MRGCGGCGRRSPGSLRTQALSRRSPSATTSSSEALAETGKEESAATIRRPGSRRPLGPETCRPEAGCWTPPGPLPGVMSRTIMRLAGVVARRGNRSGPSGQLVCAECRQCVRLLPRACPIVRWPNWAVLVRGPARRRPTVAGPRTARPSVHAGPESRELRERSWEQRPSPHTCNERPGTRSCHTRVSASP